MLAYSYLKMCSSHFMSVCRIWARRTEAVCGLLKGKCLGMGAADWTITFLSLLNWVSRFRQEMILIRYAKLAVGLHLCRNHFAYSFGLRKIFSRHFGLHDPSFFFCPHITVLIVRPFQYRLIHMDFFNESKNQIYLYLIVLILYYAEKTAAFILTQWLLGTKFNI